MQIRRSPILSREERSVNVGEHELLRVIDRLYATAVGEANWNSALMGVTGLFGGAGAGVLDVDPQLGQMGDFAAYGCDRDQARSIGDLLRINPRMHYSASAPVGHVAYDGLFITEREMDRHEFYDALNTFSGFRYFLGSKLSEDRAGSAYAALHFGPSHGHPSKFEIDLFGLLTKHVRNAWRLCKSNGAADANLPPFLCERVPWGIVTIDHQGRIVTMNARAERMTAAGDGLRTSGRKLQAWKAAENRSLQKLIGATMRARDRRTLEAGGALRVARPSGRAEYVVQVFPNIRNGRQCDVQPAVVIYITDPENPQPIPNHHLVSAFGLSEREALLASLLARGESLAKAASIMRVSRNTARNHLQSVFRKTATNSQAGLQRILRTLVTVESKCRS